jgi:hypothetical protein
MLEGRGQKKCHKQLEAECMHHARESKRFGYNQS